LDRAAVEKMFLDAGITEEVMANLLKGMGISTSLDMENDPNRFFLSCKLLSLIQNNIEITDEAATAYVQRPCCYRHRCRRRRQQWGGRSACSAIRGYGAARWFPSVPLSAPRAGCPLRCPLPALLPAPLTNGVRQQGRATADD